MKYNRWIVFASGTVTVVKPYVRRHSTGQLNRKAVIASQVSCYESNNEPSSSPLSTRDWGHVCPMRLDQHDAIDVLPLLWAVLGENRTNPH